MDDKLQEDSLDAQLRDEAPYIDDAGFTSGVVRKLPARQVRRSYRNFILLGITLAACIAAYLLAGGSNFAFDTFANVAFLPRTTAWRRRSPGPAVDHGRIENDSRASATSVAICFPNASTSGNFCSGLR